MAGHMALERASLQVPMAHAALVIVAAAGLAAAAAGTVAGAPWPVRAGSSTWTPRQLQQRINASIAAGARTLAMPGGDYFFEGSSLVIAGATGFELHVAAGAAPAQLWFEIGHGLLVDSSSDVSVVGPLELDYTTGAHFQGTVANASSSAVLVRTEAGWLDPDVFMARYGHMTTSESSSGMRWTKASGFGEYVSDSTVMNGTPEKVGPGLFRYRHKGVSDSEGGTAPALAVGDKLTVRIRGGYTLHAHNSSRVSYSNISIHGSSFMAITEFGGFGGHIYQDVKVARRSGDTAAEVPSRAHGLIASNADCFHSSAARDGPHLNNVELSWCLVSDLPCNIRRERG